jgi:hypothetical protein
MGFSVVFQASTGKKLRENNHGSNYGTRKFDAKHSAIDWYFFPDPKPNQI